MMDINTVLGRPNLHVLYNEKYLTFCRNCYWNFIPPAPHTIFSNKNRDEIYSTILRRDTIPFNIDNVAYKIFRL